MTPSEERKGKNQFIKINRKVLTIKPMKAWAVIGYSGSFIQMGDLAKPKYVMAIFKEKEHALEKVKNMETSWSVVPVIVTYKPK